MANSSVSTSNLPTTVRFDIDEADRADINNRKVKKFLTPMQLMKYLRFALASKTPSGKFKKMLSVMIWGSPGVGKTDVIRQLAKQWGYRLVALHLPQYDPTDVKGIVVRLSDDTIKWMPSSYLPGYHSENHIHFPKANDAARHQSGDYLEYRVSYKFPYASDVVVRVMQDGKDITDKFSVKVGNPTNEVMITPNKDFVQTAPCTVEVYENAILFLDELSAADIEVQKAALQLVLDRRVGEYDLPPTCPVVAAGNMEQDGAFTNPMSGPLSNRFNHVKLVHSLSEWMSYEIESGHANAEVLAFLANHGAGYLHRYESSELTEGNNGFATPRSWSILSEQLNAISEFPDLTDDDAETLVIGQIGEKVGTAFIGFRAVRSKLPDVAAILRNEDVAVSHNFDLASKYMIAMILSLNLGTHIYPEEYDRETKRGTKKWVDAREGYFKFITKHLPPDVQYFSVSMMQHKMNVIGSALMGEGFSMYTKEIMKLQKNVSAARNSR